MSIFFILGTPSRGAPFSGTLSNGTPFASFLFRRELDNIRRQKEAAEEAEKEREDALYRQYEEHRHAIDKKQNSLDNRLHTIHEEIGELERAKLENKENFEDVMQQSKDRLSLIC